MLDVPKPLRTTSITRRLQTHLVNRELVGGDLVLDKKLHQGLSQFNLRALAQLSSGLWLARGERA